MKVVAAAGKGEGDGGDLGYSGNGFALAKAMRAPGRTLNRKDEGANNVVEAPWTMAESSAEVLGCQQGIRQILARGEGEGSYICDRMECGEIRYWCCLLYG